MSYFNYHAKIRNLIKTGECLSASIVNRHNHISPAIVFYFKNHKPMPIRDYMWNEYLPLIKQYNIKLDNPDNIDFETTIY